MDAKKINDLVDAVRRVLKRYDAMEYQGGGGAAVFESIDRRLRSALKDLESSDTGSVVCEWKHTSKRTWRSGCGMAWPGSVETKCPKCDLPVQIIQSTVEIPDLQISQEPKECGFFPFNGTACKKGGRCSEHHGRLCERCGDPADLEAFTGGTRLSFCNACYDESFDSRN